MQPAVSTDSNPSLVVRTPGLVDYTPTWEDMQGFTASRQAATPDELWLLQHPPVYTLGRNGKEEHLLAASDIPVIKVDRGGQVTYHGPGQLVAYTLIDLKRRKLGVQSLVHLLEQAVMNLLADFGVTAARRNKAPGVYVDGRKVAALGLRVRRGCSFHGLALNVDMDLAPFNNINPCGFEGLEVTQLRDLGIGLDVQQAGAAWQAHFEDLLAKT